MIHIKAQAQDIAAKLQDFRNELNTYARLDADYEAKCSAELGRISLILRKLQDGIHGAYTASKLAKQKSASKPTTQPVPSVLDTMPGS